MAARNRPGGTASTAGTSFIIWADEPADREELTTLARDAGTRWQAGRVTEFVKQDFTGARFEQVDFSRAWFRNVYVTGATRRGAWLEDVDIDGEIRNVRINGVGIVPLVEAELNRRY